MEKYYEALQGITYLDWVKLRTLLDRTIDPQRGPKKISEMTEKEILRQQMKLLAEHSAMNCCEEIPRLTEAMCQVYKTLG